MDQITGDPPDLSGIRLLLAGSEWDAVRVSRWQGLAILNRLRSKPGPVLVDPRERVLYFFVPPGSADSWGLSETWVLGAAQYVAVPPPHRETPPGPYWLIRPRQPWALANPLHLEAALRADAGAKSEPRDACRATVALCEYLPVDALRPSTVPEPPRAHAGTNDRNVAAEVIDHAHMATPVEHRENWPTVREPAESRRAQGVVVPLRRMYGYGDRAQQPLAARLAEHRAWVEPTWFPANRGVS